MALYFYENAQFCENLDIFFLNKIILLNIYEKLSIVWYPFYTIIKPDFFLNLRSFVKNFDYLKKTYTFEINETLPIIWYTYCKNMTFEFFKLFSKIGFYCENIHVILTIYFFLVRIFFPRVLGHIVQIP